MKSKSLTDAELVAELRRLRAILLDPPSEKQADLE